VTHPFGPALERAMLVNAELVAIRVKQVMGGTATPPWRWKGRIDGVKAEVAPMAVAAVAKPVAAAAVAVDGEPILMPFGDLTVDSGRLVRWTVAAGATVKKGDTVAEIETDKAVVEIEAPADGVVRQLVTEAGTVVKMGGVIGAVK